MKKTARLTLLLQASSERIRQQERTIKSLRADGRKPTPAVAKLMRTLGINRCEAEAAMCITAECQR